MEAIPLTRTKLGTFCIDFNLFLNFNFKQFDFKPRNPAVTVYCGCGFNFILSWCHSGAGRIKGSLVVIIL